jgi:hypothetical protein
MTAVSLPAKALVRLQNFLPVKTRTEGRNMISICKRKGRLASCQQNAVADFQYFWDGNYLVVMPNFGKVFRDQPSGAGRVICI